ncbi:GtrA family protein [Aquicoccus sp. SCR17]|nr:GtrA family protein [Carideicomes alvinocaridis]
MSPSVLRQFARFAAVGGVGFLVDGGLLYALVHFGAAPLLARALSFPAAVTVTWSLNRSWTFAASGPPGEQARRYRRYFVIQVVGALSNYLVYAFALALTGLSAAGAVQALAIGALAGLAVNFAGARLLVFQDAPTRREGYDDVKSSR